MGGCRSCPLWSWLIMNWDASMGRTGLDSVGRDKVFIVRNLTMVDGFFLFYIYICILKVYLGHWPKKRQRVWSARGVGMCVLRARSFEKILIGRGGGGEGAKTTENVNLNECLENIWHFKEIILPISNKIVRRGCIAFCPCGRPPVRVAIGSGA